MASTIMALVRIFGTSSLLRDEIVQEGSGSYIYRKLELKSNNNKCKPDDRALTMPFGEICGIRIENNTRDRLGLLAELH
jgi:hypothetical protein